MAKITTPDGFIIEVDRTELGDTLQTLRSLKPSSGNGTRERHKGASSSQASNGAQLASTNPRWTPSGAQQAVSNLTEVPKAIWTALIRANGEPLDSASLCAAARIEPRGLGPAIARIEAAAKKVHSPSPLNTEYLRKGNHRSVRVRLTREFLTAFTRKEGVS